MSPYLAPDLGLRTGDLRVWALQGTLGGPGHTGGVTVPMQTCTTSCDTGELEPGESWQIWAPELPGKAEKSIY